MTTHDDPARRATGAQSLPGAAAAVGAAVAVGRRRRRGRGAPRRSPACSSAWRSCSPWCRWHRAAAVSAGRGRPQAKDRLAPSLLIDGVRARDAAARLAVYHASSARARRGSTASSSPPSMRGVIGDGGGALPRDRRHAADHAARRPDRGADRHHGRDLPGRVRQGPARPRAHVLRRRDDRHPVDRRRPVRLRAVRALLRPGHPVRLRRRGRAVRADDPGRGPVDRGDAEARSPASCARPRTPSACRSGGRSSRSCCRPRVAGIVTGVMLAIARVVGETAPLLLIAGASTRSTSTRSTAHADPAGLRLQLVQPARRAAPSSDIDRAWAAALTLIIIVLMPQPGRPPRLALLRAQAPTSR